MEKLIMKELSEKEELYLPTSFILPHRFADKLKWSDEYCVQMTLDEENGRLIVTQSDIKVKDNLVPILENKDFYIVREYEKGRKYAELAKELGMKWWQVQLRYKYACCQLEQYINGKAEFEIPGDFVIPESIKKSAFSINLKTKPLKKFTQRHAIAMEQWIAGETFREMGEKLGIKPNSAKSLWETAFSYLRDYLDGRIELAMPDDFVITEEIREAINKENEKRRL